MMPERIIFEETINQRLQQHRKKTMNLLTKKIKKNLINKMQK
jgi:hypothetical protein